MRMAVNILLVEDEPAIQQMVAMALRKAGYEVGMAGDALEAQSRIAGQLPDLILLDWMLPGMSGVEYARQLKKNDLTREVPVIMLTARGEESDKIRGFDSGADDYVTKPFGIRELLARVKAFLRRQGSEANGYEFGDYRLDLTAHKLFKKGVEIELTAKEFRLLEFFVKRAGRALTRDSILAAVWGDEVIVTDRSVDRCVTTLRGKIERDPRSPRFIQTIRDIGYRFEDVETSKH